MFTTVKPPQINERRRAAGEPQPEVISHRDDELETKKWSEKMRHEETTYKHLRHHRDSLLESEIMYKKTIKELKQEKAELIDIYEPTYRENKVLKSIIDHGPDAVKMKKLQKASKELREEVGKLKDENQKLTEQINEVMKKHTAARDYVLEKNWQEILVNNKNNKRAMKTEQRSFPVKEDISFNKARSLFEKADMQEQDMYDLELDTVEKEIQVISNNVKYLKKQKKQVDYAVMNGKGAVVKNSSIENAIFDKLDGDLKAFKGNIKSAKKKHADLKQKLTEKENDAKTKENAAKDISEDQKIYEQVTEAVKTKSYQTIETQTDIPTELKRAKSDMSSDRLKLSKKQIISQLRSRAVQTDFLKGKELRNSDVERMEYLDQYEKKKIKQKEPNKIPPKEAALQYAKKLVIRRRDTHHNRTDLSENNHQEAKTHKCQDTTAKDQVNYSIKPTKKVKIHSSNRDLIVDRSHLPPKAKDSYKLKGDSSQNIEPTYDSKWGAHEKNKRPLHSNFRDMLVDRSNFSYKPKNLNSVTEFRSSRIKSRSVGDLDKQLNIDYRDKIMIPVTNSNKLIKTSKSLKSKRNIDLNDKRKHRIDKVTTSLPAKERHTNDDSFSEVTHVWKSESDLRVLVENEDTKNQLIKEFKCSIPRGGAYIHLRGEMQTENKEKRDESAYDEVLSDLNRQYKFQGEDICHEFQRTVQTFRHYKDSIRREQKIKNQGSDYLPSIEPYAPVRFTTDARQVTAKECVRLMKKNGVNFT